MALTNERGFWETFVRTPGDLREGVELPLALRDLNPGRKKYSVRHVVAILTRNPREPSKMDALYVRTVVGVRLPDAWGIKIVRDLPVELPGKPYRDFFESLRLAAAEPSRR